MTTLPPENDGTQVPGQPQQPQYQAPPAPGAAPGAEQPYAQAGYQQPAASAVSTLQLNYWLSVFFSWIPALIFWLIEKDKGDQRATALHVANFNFSLLRTGVYVVTVIIGWIPYIGWLIALLLWIASIVLFIFHIIAAAKVREAYERGQADPFIFNIPLVK